MKPHDPVLDELLARGRLGAQTREAVLSRVLDAVRRRVIDRTARGGRS